LCERWPDLHPREREDKICDEHRAVFIIGIGGELADGQPHDGRAPDYDDWTTPNSAGGRGLNGDLLLWSPVLNRAFEISSMGVRVDPATFREQLKIRRLEERLAMDFHRKLIAGELPQTMGGGIGQSRLCMFFLRSVHVGEAACGVWPAAMREACRRSNVILL
jgi:aspartate--ammonia ligase